MALSKRQAEGVDTVHYVSPRKRRERPRVRIQPPLTPMIDVTFQLLIYFLTVSEFRLPEGQIPGTLPEKGQAKASADVAPTEPIFIILRPAPGGAIYEIQGQEITIAGPKELYDSLMARRAILLAPDTVPVVIVPNLDVPWEHVVEAFNQAVRAKFKRIGFGGRT